jgi:hypothetical protein
VKLLNSINMNFVEEISLVFRAVALMTMPKCNKCGKNLPTFRRKKLSPSSG